MFTVLRQMSQQVAGAASVVPASALHAKVLVLGSGSGGCAVAAQLNRALGAGSVTVLDPSAEHYYQPMFTLIGGGIHRLSDARRPMADVVPAGVRWLRAEAAEIDPHRNRVLTTDGQPIDYDTLIVAVGIRANYDRIPGLREALNRDRPNVTSIYSPQYVHGHFDALQRFAGGPMLFTFPQPPVKCPGAPQKIAYLSEHWLRRHGKRDAAQLRYISALPVLFGVPYFADALWPIARSRAIDVTLGHHLVEVDGDRNRAVFESCAEPGQRLELEYALMHVTPPQEVPAVLKRSAESDVGLVNAAGFVDVDDGTLQHRRFENVFAIGDCTSTPNSKTMAAAAAQSGVLVRNVRSMLAGRKPTATYDGYAACPLVTGYDSCVMAEFDYKLQPLETFPVAQNRERYSMFLLKKYAMPAIYWHGMVTGWWTGPSFVRRALSVFRMRSKASTS